MEPLTICEEAQDLDGYAAIPIAFEVTRRFRVEADMGGLRLVEEPVCPSYWKDYDRLESPLTWRRWDLSQWGFLGAFLGPRRIGGAAIAWRTPGLTRLEEREDLAVLWDLRVHPDFRRSGAGRALFAKAAEGARARGCRVLKVETQNVNVQACRFYAAQGCVLGAISTRAYPGLPEEAQLLWYLDL